MAFIVLMKPDLDSFLVVPECIRGRDGVVSRNQTHKGKRVSGKVTRASCAVSPC